jgi:hypothetical protein
MKQLAKTFLFIVMSALAASAAALDSLDRWSGVLWSNPLPADKDSRSVVMTRDGPGRYKNASAVTTITRRADGGWTRDYDGPDECSRTEFLANGRIASSRAENARERKTYQVSVDPGRGQASFRTEAAGKAPVHKNLVLKPGSILMSEYPNLIRQAWRNGVRGGFSLKSLAPDGSIELDIQTRLIETDALAALNAAYEFPPDFRDAYPATRSYLVADFSLGGFIGLIYPFHTYSIFSLGPDGPEYLGYFGGDPKEAVFTFTDKGNTPHE